MNESFHMTTLIIRERKKNFSHRNIRDSQSPSHKSLHRLHHRSAQRAWTYGLCVSRNMDSNRKSLISQSRRTKCIANGCWGNYALHVGRKELATPHALAGSRRVKDLCAKDNHSADRNIERPIWCMELNLGEAQMFAHYHNSHFPFSVRCGAHICDTIGHEAEAGELSTIYHPWLGINRTQRKGKGGKRGWRTGHATGKEARETSAHKAAQTSTLPRKQKLHQSSWMPSELSR